MAFIAAVVKPEERTAVMGITAMLRTLAAMAGPTVTGLLAARGQFWIAFVMAGCCRLAYDFGLYAMFVDTKLHENENLGENSSSSRDETFHAHNDEMELHSLADDDGDENFEDRPVALHKNVSNSALTVPTSKARARSRSPHRYKDVDD